MTLSPETLADLLRLAEAERDEALAEAESLRATLVAVREGRDAAVAEAWKAGRDAASAHVAASARAWKDTDPDTARALSRAAVGILTLTRTAACGDGDACTREAP